MLFLSVGSIFSENLPFFRGGGGVYSVVATKTQILALNRERGDVSWGGGDLV